jgi:uncharacterized protein (DUF1800 family)
MTLFRLYAFTVALCLTLASFLAPVLHAQVISTAPQSQNATAGTTATFTVAATGTGSLSYQWQFNGSALANGATVSGATSATLTLSNIQPANTGIYTVVVTSGTTSTTASAILGLATTTKLFPANAGLETANIPHPNGNIYDQILLQGSAASVRADSNQILRMSFVDLTDDIVQVEFSGPGTLSLVLDNATGPAVAVKYNQPTVSYMRGHASIVISGATENTHLSIFSVGSLTSPNLSLFPAGMSYDGLADVARVAILSTDGKFGGIRTANTSYFASQGLTGIYAPGVAVSGPVYLGDIDAFATATPAIVLGSTSDARVTGGNLQQTNSQPVTVSGLTVLNFVAGTKSNGVTLTAQTVQGQLTQNGVNVTSQIAASGPTIVSVATGPGVTDETGAASGQFVFTRTGSTTAPLTVTYGVGGTATNGIDYPALVGFVTIPAGAASANVTVQPYPDTTVESTESIIVTLSAGTGFSLGTTSATLSITDSVGTLYVANLRPTVAGSSSASGLATLVLSASGTVATVHVSFSNLSSGQTGAHLFLGTNTSSGDYLLNLPLGQVNGSQWTIQATATATSTQILDALRNGLIYVGLDTAQHPAGELSGAFLSALGSQTFVAPVAPPTAALTSVTSADAARLLTQATFGPKRAEIDALTGGDISAWITAQMALPATSHRTRTMAELDYTPITGNTNPNRPLPFHRQQAWMFNILQGPDQLRQRMAFALSQILVVSDTTLNGDQYTEGLAHYYDTLANHAFGSFRALLEQVTLSPIMGTYLSHLKNAKADPATKTNPDENYAREIMQLFTIGLVQLQPDGTLKLDTQGLPIATYDNTTITEMAKVFTGWGFSSTLANPNFRSAPANYINSMMIYSTSHEPGAKDIVNGTNLPANLGGNEDLRRTLDALVAHPNTAPFIARRLIQRFVTNNPSPAYVYRVASQFGATGDLGAMVRAILTDYEARSPNVIDDPGYGKLREPLLRLTGFLRTFNATAQSGHYAVNFNNPENSLAQTALRSPTVFNFYEPGYVYPGPLAAAGLVAPEFQITNDTTAISTPNFFRDTIFRTAAGTNASNLTVLGLSTEQDLVPNPPALLDHLNLVLCQGHMTTATRNRILLALGALSSGATPLERAQTAILLTVTSPDGATQR